MKAYTDIERSKVLAKILPLESADMFYNEEPDEPYPKDIVDSKYPMVIREGQKCCLEEYGIPCWSLAALLGVLPNYQLQTQDDGIGILCSCKRKFNIVTADNPVNACVAMIEKLHELNLL